MDVKEINIKNIAQYCIANVFRSNTDSAGFVHLDFGTHISSNKLRTIMVDLKTELSKFTTERYNKTLTYQWLGRFDQQVSTPYHLDNASDQSFLMLGYEPSEIESELFLADYHKFSKESEGSLDLHFDKSNPIFKGDETILKPYISEVKAFDKNTYKIILINNSSSNSLNDTLGVFHMARVIKPDLSKSRVINSMMLNLMTEGENNEIEISEDEFKNTEYISK